MSSKYGTPLAQTDCPKAQQKPGFRLMCSPSASPQALLPQAGKAVKAQREANRCLAGLIVETVF
jgi:hypothetical protein